ncbi:aquaporin Z [Egbenema bharatensis]|uniref:aquaporin Z n=1 Tax=Egbenema bharatensis TaxID=3463334 RepID=UPI003A8B7138
MPLGKRCIAEFIGTFWLVFGGCGSAVLAAQFPYGGEFPDTSNIFGLGFLGVSLAFGLTVMTMAYAIGHISGCHLNPAVSFGLWAGKKFPGSELLPYILAQVIGAIVAALVIYIIASGNGPVDFSGSNPLATNGFGDHSPGGYGVFSAFLIEILLTFIFLFVILGATDGRAPVGFAPAAIGMCLTLIHLISIPVTNTSVNPARSTGPALIVGIFGNNLALFGQLWLFWLAPIVGAILAGWVYSSVFAVPPVTTTGERVREPV